MKAIANYYPINPKLATSGQPTREQFQQIANAGYNAVVNLALPSSDNALADEAAIVTALGMVYFQIPVIWEAPTLDDVNLFFDLMQALQNRKTWVHCALNMRVSCFVYLFRKHILNCPETEAMYPMQEIWQPNPVWQRLIQDVETQLRSADRLATNALNP